MKSLLKKLLLITAIILSSISVAESAELNGAKLYKDKCLECHGEKGNSITNTIPTIAGFSSILIFDTIIQFKEGDRIVTKVKNLENKFTSMAEISKQLSEEESMAISFYLSKQKFNPVLQKRSKAAQANQGKQLHEELCDDCHGDYGKSALDDAPILAGQWKDYLTDQFKQFSDYERYMPKRMTRKFKKLSEQDKISLISFYINEK